MLSHADSKASPSFMYEVVSSALMKWDPCILLRGKILGKESVWSVAVRNASQKSGIIRDGVEHKKFLQLHKSDSAASGEPCAVVFLLSQSK